jgi:acyl carrier protein
MERPARSLASVATVRHIVAEHAAIPSESTPDGDLIYPRDQLYGDIFTDEDSLDLIDIVMGIEEALGVEIGDKEAAALATVEDLVHLWEASEFRA